MYEDSDQTIDENFAPEYLDLEENYEGAGQEGSADDIEDFIQEVAPTEEVRGAKSEETLENQAALEKLMALINAVKNEPRKPPPFMEEVDQAAVENEVEKEDETSNAGKLNPPFETENSGNDSGSDSAENSDPSQTYQYIYEYFDAYEYDPDAYDSYEANYDSYYQDWLDKYGDTFDKDYAPLLVVQKAKPPPKLPKKYPLNNNFPPSWAGPRFNRNSINGPSNSWSSVDTLMAAAQPKKKETSNFS